MNSAEKVIAKFGSQSALAGLLGKRQSTVQHWAKSGVIPAKWQPQLLELAVSRGIDLSPADFMQAVVTEIRGVPPKPFAKWHGVLPIGNVELPCYVLSDERRVISRNGATSLLAGTQSGDLESYIGIGVLKPYLTEEPSLIEFEMEGVKNKVVRGLTAESFLDICRAYVRARDDSALKTDRQETIAKHASMFLSACAKVGLIALIDECTGFQYERTQEALQVKLKLFLEEEMREWEKTFPDQLWMEFGRLTKWKGPVHSRPRYWGHLVMELVYGYLDKDVTEWLKKNAPAPRHGQNYHQWLSSQYGLKKLTEHLWMLIGMAAACHSMPELREKMAERFGKGPVQITLYLPPRPAQINPAGTKESA